MTPQTQAAHSECLEAKPEQTWNVYSGNMAVIFHLRCVRRNVSHICMCTLSCMKFSEVQVALGVFSKTAHTENTVLMFFGI